MALLATLLICLLHGACSPMGGAEDGATTDGDLMAPVAATPPMARPPAATVDSILPIDEALRRFRADLPRTDSLTGGAQSRGELADRFLAAVGTQDTVSLRSLVIDAAEFAYLYYPTSDQARPPRAQGPALAWFLIQQNSEKGATRALRRLGGQSLRMMAMDCDDEPRREGRNLLWSGCTVELAVGSTRTPVLQRLFGTILERDGRYKFMSYSNQF